MECPRCGESLTTFTLADSQAAVCESCEFVGIPADLRPDASPESETWEDALQRFLEESTPDADDNTSSTDETDAGTANDGDEN